MCLFLLHQIFLSHGASLLPHGSGGSPLLTNEVILPKLQSREECVTSPDAYMEIFELVQWNGEEPRCVGQNLMTTIQGPYNCDLNNNDHPNTVSQYSTATWGWVSPSFNLDEYLKIAHAHPGDSYNTMKEMIKFVGISEDQADPSCSYDLAVMERSLALTHGLFAPTWAELLPKVIDYFPGCVISWDVQKELVFRGFEDFDNLTGCHNREPPCGNDFEEAQKICHEAIHDGTAACVQAFADNYNGCQSANAAQVRAMLDVCCGANPLFTGLGYGWDRERYTGPEFLVDNVNMEEQLGAKRLTLYAPGMSKP